VNAPLKITSLPSTATSYPFGTAQLLDGSIGIDLAANGYLEEEYLITGTASVWTYDESFRPVVAQADEPFTSRVLVRRPTDPARASGVVQLEPLHPDLDSAFIWGAIHPWILREGHTWVGATVFSPTATQLRDQVNPERYRALNIPAPGQEYDILGAVAEALKDGAFPNIVHLQHIVLSGWSATGSFCRVFLQDGFHERWRNKDGDALVDGYVICISSGGTGLSGYPPLSPSCPPLPTDDPRRTVQPHDTTVFEILSEMESETNEASLREDSDEPDDRYRLYQLAGTAHIEQRQEVLPNRAQYEKSGGRRFHLETEELRSDGRLDLLARAYFAAQLDWIIDNVVAPHGGRFTFGRGYIELPPGRFDREGMPRTTARELERDSDGNVLGGVRSPWIVVPTARYAPHSTPTKDAENPPEWMPFAQPAMLAMLMGSRVPFSAEELTRRYGSFDHYRELFADASDELVAAGLLLEPESHELLIDVGRRWGKAS